MFKKKKNLKPNLPKEYIWALEIEGVDHELKCVVYDDEVVTYEDGVEHKHLKVTDHTCEVGVLQIDCETKLFGEMIPFQLERYIPYIKLDRWLMSDTTREDRMAEQIQIYKNQSKWEVILGVAVILLNIGIDLFFPDFGEVWMFSVFGVFFIASAAYRMVRLRNEINAIDEARKEMEENEQAMKEYLEDRNPVFHKTEEE